MWDEGKPTDGARGTDRMPKPRGGIFNITELVNFLLLCLTLAVGFGLVLAVILAMTERSAPGP